MKKTPCISFLETEYGICFEVTVLKKPMVQCKMNDEDNDLMIAFSRSGCLKDSSRD